MFEHDGHLFLDLHGHGKTHVCAAATAVFHGASLTLMSLADEFPNDLEVERDAEDRKKIYKDQATRRRKTRR